MVLKRPDAVVKHKRCVRQLHATISEWHLYAFAQAPFDSLAVRALPCGVYPWLGVSGGGAVEILRRLRHGQ